jgi:hypothetical protein
LAHFHRQDAVEQQHALLRERDAFIGCERGRAVRASGARCDACGLVSHHGVARRREKQQAPERRAAFGSDAIEFARSRGTRLLTADFRAGDVIVFGMYLAHGSLDNHSPIDRVRLSCDVRWQPASLPVDDRYFGDDPPGTTGAGYAELNGAKPLTQDWHVR